jgi:hypothetical protein
MFLKRQNYGCNSRFQLKKRRKIRRKFLVVFGKNFPEFPENFLPKFIEIFLIFLFLKDKISAVTCVSSPENAGKSGGNFPGIFPEKISRHFPEFPRISKFPKISQYVSRKSYENNGVACYKKNNFSAVVFSVHVLHLNYMEVFSVRTSKFSVNFPEVFCQYGEYIAKHLSSVTRNAY